MSPKNALVWMMLAATGCVSKGKYDEALKTADDARIATARASAETESHDRACAARNAQLAIKLHQLEANFDAETLANGELRRALDDSGKNADQLLSEKGTLSVALEQSRARLEELRRAQAAAESRAALYRSLAVKLQNMIGAGEVTIGIREGRMVLAMPNDVLFDSGKTEIKRAGQTVLEGMALVLKTVPRRFQVAGHTDNVPIQTERFPSNWELSASRALSVIHFLTVHGVPVTSLSAAGYGEFDPVASNKEEAGRRRNRRIEIVLQPNIDELVAVPEAR